MSETFSLCNFLFELSNPLGKEMLCIVTMWVLFICPIIWSDTKVLNMSWILFLTEKVACGRCWVLHLGLENEAWEITHTTKLVEHCMVSTLIQYSFLYAIPSPKQKNIFLFVASRLRNLGHCSDGGDMTFLLLLIIFNMVILVMLRACLINQVKFCAQVINIALVWTILKQRNEGLFNNKTRSSKDLGEWY